MAASNAIRWGKGHTRGAVRCAGREAPTVVQRLACCLLPFVPRPLTRGPRPSITLVARLASAVSAGHASHRSPIAWAPRAEPPVPPPLSTRSDVYAMVGRPLLGLSVLGMPANPLYNQAKTSEPIGPLSASSRCSDVYAMGGRPLLALSVLGMPVNVLPPAVISAIVQGGADACRAAGIPLAGGCGLKIYDVRCKMVTCGQDTATYCATRGGRVPSSGSSAGWWVRAGLGGRMHMGFSSTHIAGGRAVRCQG